VSVVQPNPRELIERHARELVFSLAEIATPPTLRIAEVEGRIACLILVWDAAERMPTIGPERHRRPSGARADCKADILDAIRTANRPQTRKEVVKALRRVGKHHGVGTVAKALADLTATGELMNPKDKKGYRMPQWFRRRKTPSLFEEDVESECRSDRVG
jgi:hypothetical protein